MALSTKSRKRLEATMARRAEAKEVADAIDTASASLKITLSAAAEAGNAIVVTGQVMDLAGNNVTSAVQVQVRSLAVTADQGDITVTAGTEKKTVNPTTGENVSWIQTTAAGAFAVSIANTAAEATLVQALTNGGLVSNLLLTFV